MKCIHGEHACTTPYTCWHECDASKLVQVNSDNSCPDSETRRPAWYERFPGLVWLAGFCLCVIAWALAAGLAFGFFGL